MEPKMLATDIANFLNVTVQAVHNQIKRKNLSFKKSSNRIYFPHETSRKILDLKLTPKVITFQIVKGGTGKTAICHSVAVRASLYGAKTLCIDLDQQGNLTTAFRVDADQTPIMVEVINQKLPIKDAIIRVHDGLDLIPSRIENALLDSNLMLKRFPLDRVYKEIIQPLKRDYDIILIDCPPALGSSVIAAALASDYIISPVTPSAFSLSGLQITKNELKNINDNFGIDIPVHVLLNKFDGRTSLSHEILRLLIKHPVYSQKLFKTAIRINQEFENVITKGASIFDSLKISPAKEDIDLLTTEILEIGSFTKEIDVSKTLKPEERLETVST